MYTFDDVMHVTRRHDVIIKQFQAIGWRGLPGVCARSRVAAAPDGDHVIVTMSHTVTSQRRAWALTRRQRRVMSLIAHR